MCFLNGGRPPSWILSEAKFQSISGSRTPILVSGPNIVRLWAIAAELWALYWLFKMHWNSLLSAASECQRLPACYYNISNFCNFVISSIYSFVLSPVGRCYTVRTENVKKITGARGMYKGWGLPRKFWVSPKTRIFDRTFEKKRFWQKKFFSLWPCGIFKPLWCRCDKCPNLTHCIPGPKNARGWNSFFGFSPCRTTKAANMVPISANLRSLGTTKQAWSWRNPDKTEKSALTRYLGPRHLR